MCRATSTNSGALRASSHRSGKTIPVGAHGAGQIPEEVPRSPILPRLRRLPRTKVVVQNPASLIWWPNRRSSSRRSEKRDVPKRLAELAEALLTGRRARLRRELVLHHARQPPELVHAARSEACVVIVEEHEGALDRIGGAIELLVPLPHFCGFVLLGLLELRDLAVPDHPQVDIFGRDVRRALEILILRPDHWDVAVSEEIVDVIPEPRLVSEFDGVRVFVHFERTKELLHHDPMPIELDGRRKLRDKRPTLLPQLLGGYVEPPQVFRHAFQLLLMGDPLRHLHRE